MIWVIAGTLDGRTLAVDIQERTGEEVLVTVVSQYGAELAAHKGITVHTGRLDQEAMQDLIKKHNVRLLIDASHPYAALLQLRLKMQQKQKIFLLFALNVKRYHCQTMKNCIL